MTSDLQNYLNFYKKLEEPGFGVLVTGDWGVGKTHQVEKALRDEQPYYVSLYGIRTIEECHAAVIAVTDPGLSTVKKILGASADAAGSAGGYFSLGQLGANVLAYALRGRMDTSRILIFDDLERSSLPITDLLGFINTYIEHKGCKVVVIAHDRKLANQFLEAKEKSFGHTIAADPQTNEAYEAFCNDKIIKTAENIFKDHKKTILELFHQSEAKSLRILRFVMSDLARLCTALLPAHLDNKDAANELVRLFTALSIEVRKNTLKAEDLRSRSDTEWGYRLKQHSDNETAKPPLLVAQARYPEVDLTSTLLQDDVLVDTLINGRYDEHKIRGSIDSSPYFLQPQQIAPWKTAIQFDQINDDLVQDAVRRLNEQFDKRAVVESGELLHIFALLLMMSENNISKKDLKTTLDECKKYIDDLLEAERLPPAETDFMWHRHLDHGYDGFAYWVTPTTQVAFEDAKAHLIDQRQEALRRQYPVIAQRLIATLKGDPEQFTRLISPSTVGPSTYCSVPVLSSIDAQAFVDAWISLPKDRWRIITTSLNERYKYCGEEVVRDEKKWIDEVRSKLEEKATSSDSWAALRLRRILPRKLPSQ